LRDRLATAAREVTDPADEVACYAVARAQERHKVGSERHARAVYAHEVAREPHARKPGAAHIEIVRAPARQERERIVGRGTIGIGNDRAIITVVPAPAHLVPTVQTPRDPA